MKLLSPALYSPYRDVVENPANPSASTRDFLEGVSAQYLKIKMQKPHPRLGKHEEMYRYAIREIGIFANKLEPGIGDCREAANSDDTRDKYFIKYVTLFDKEFAKKAATLGEDVMAKKRSLEALSGKLEELLPDMDTCRDDKVQHSRKIASLLTAAGRLLSGFQQTTERTKLGSFDRLDPGNLHVLEHSIVP